MPWHLGPPTSFFRNALKANKVMNVRALATDYDGTIAWHGAVEPATCRALERFRESGRKVLLVTGREIPDLLSVFSEPSLFDVIVADNGALRYHPATKAMRTLATH